jgi:hypothetical protein
MHCLAEKKLTFASLCCGVCEPQCYTPTCASYAVVCADDDMPTSVEAKPTISRKCL